MASRIERVSITGDVAELRRRRSATGAALAGVTALPLWVPSTGIAPDVFTITGPSDTTHTLTRLPLGVNGIFLNGLLMLEGTDYTLDYTTGVITVSTPLVASDVVAAHYVTTGTLIAQTLTPDVGSLSFAGSYNSDQLGNGPARWVMATPMVVGAKVGGAWSYLNVPPDQLVDMDIADAYSVETTVTTALNSYYQWMAGWGDGKGTGVMLQTDGSTGWTLYLRRNHATVLFTLATGGPPVAGDTVKVVCDFSTTTATAYANGTSIGTLNFSAETWYTADGSLA